MSKIIYRDPNVVVFQSALFQTNSTVVITDDVVMVVDPAWLPEEVLEIKHFVESVKGERLLFLIFTHSDYDHIIGYKAFQPDKIFTSESFSLNPKKEEAIEQILKWDDENYIVRPYPIEYPEGDFLIYRDGVQYRHGNTKITFYMTPGHTADSMMLIVWQYGLCIAGDYLSDIEFPFIYDSSVNYLCTLEKLLAIHDRNWFTRVVPGHGNLALSLQEWMARRIESQAYIYAVRESIATGIPLDESYLWEKYKFPRLQMPCHAENVALMTKEFRQGLWKSEPELFAAIKEEVEKTAEAEEFETE